MYNLWIRDPVMSLSYRSIEMNVTNVTCYLFIMPVSSEQRHNCKHNVSNTTEKVTAF